MALNNELYAELHAVVVKYAKKDDPALEPLETIAFLYGAVLGVAYGPETFIQALMHLEYFRQMGYKFGQETQGRASADAMLDKLMKERK